MKAGTEYEKFVQKIQQAILNADSFVSGQKTIQVERNKKIEDVHGNTREFDIYWKYQFGGIEYKTIIECKDYSKAISIEKIDALIGKTQDIPGLKLLFATTKGYQSGAQKKAEKHAIELLIVREQEDADWFDVDGRPYLRSVVLNIHAVPMPIITNFVPAFDKEWIKLQYDATKIPRVLSGYTDEIFIEDKSTNEKYSLYELPKRLAKLSYGVGTHSDCKEFTDACLIYDGLEYKLHAYHVDFIIPEIISSTTEIDFSKEIMGIVEYLQRGHTKAICKNGLIKDWSS